MLRRPESAPRCPHCGYNLHGLPRLRCPECGWAPSEPEDISHARWLADDNAADRAAVRNEWIAAIVGTVFIVAGIAMTALALWQSPGNGVLGNYYPMRDFWGGLVLTGGYLIYKWRIGESMHRILLIVGSLWLAYGLLMSLA